MLSGPKLNLFRNNGSGVMSKEGQLASELCNVWAFANINEDAFPDVLCGPNFLEFKRGQLFWMKNMRGERFDMIENSEIIAWSDEVKSTAIGDLSGTGRIDVVAILKKGVERPIVVYENHRNSGMFVRRHVETLTSSSYGHARINGRGASARVWPVVRIAHLTSGKQKDILYSNEDGHWFFLKLRNPPSHEVDRQSEELMRMSHLLTTRDVVPGLVGSNGLVDLFVVQEDVNASIIIRMIKNTGEFPLTEGTVIHKFIQKKETIVQILPLDVNGDTLTDVAYVKYCRFPRHESQMGWFMNLGNDSFSDELRIFTLNDTRLHKLEAIDLNADGRTDIAAQIGDAGALYWMMNGKCARVFFNRA